MPEIPFTHFEYVRWEPEGYYSNYVEVTKDGDDAAEKMRELVANPEVFAIHARRFPMPEQGVHAYDETQLLAKAQGEAYQYRTAFEGMIERYNTKEQAVGTAEYIISRRDTQLGELKGVIVELRDRIERTKAQLNRDVAACVHPEPHDLLTILGNPADIEKIASI